MFRRCPYTSYYWREAIFLTAFFMKSWLIFFCAWRPPSGFVCPCSYMIDSECFSLSGEWCNEGDFINGLGCLTAKEGKKSSFAGLLFIIRLWTLLSVSVVYDRYMARWFVWSWKGTGTIGPRLSSFPPPVLKSLAPFMMRSEELMIIALLCLFSLRASRIVKATLASVMSAFYMTRSVVLFRSPWVTLLILSGDNEVWFTTLRGSFRRTSIFSSSILLRICFILNSLV